METNDAPDLREVPSRYHFTDVTPFMVETAEGQVRLGAGWLAITEDEYARLAALSRNEEAGEVIPPECWPGCDDPECPYTHTEGRSTRPPPSDHIAEENINDVAPDLEPVRGDDLAAATLLGTGLADLLKRSREYVADALDAHEHTDGRDLLNAIDTALAAPSPAQQSGIDGVCEQCGAHHCAWYAPSPLWNAVMRGGSIDGPWKGAELICANCFMRNAEDAGIASNWRVSAKTVNVELETTTPTGRVWNDSTDLWDEPTAQQSGELREALAPFARVAEYDIGETEADTDIFRPMGGGYNLAPRLTVGDLRRVRKAYEALASTTPPQSREAVIEECARYLDGYAGGHYMAQSCAAALRALAPTEAPVSSPVVGK